MAKKNSKFKKKFSLSRISAIKAVTLSEEDVIRIHNALVEEFAADNNPIDPPGVKSMTLLGSAVSRQHSGLSGTLKYPDPIHNAATLAFGLCCDHPFHNGNKRTALVALLVHLDQNRLSLAGIPDKDLFDLVLAIAKHIVVPNRGQEEDPRKRPSADEEVAAIAEWLRLRVKPFTRGDRQITFKQLRKILSRWNYELGDPDGNNIKIYRVVQEKPLFRPLKTVRYHVTTITYPRENVILSLDTIKYIRQKCKLREEDGIDSDAFYAEGAVIDTFINQHRTILRRLANR